MKILKFGGSSVGNPERIENVINIITNSLKENNGNIAVVFSAFQTVTDSLIEVSSIASKGDPLYSTTFRRLEAKHHDAIKELIHDKDNLRRTSEYVISLLKELSDVLYGIFLIKELSLRTLDFIMSFGERLSAYIISKAIRDKGIEAEFLDSRTLVKTDESFGYGHVRFEITNNNIKEYFKEHKNPQIITGFIASTMNGDTITIGRGGSDFTAAIFGAALNVDEIEIWTDVDGVMTADPRKVKRAFALKTMTYEEAMEMSHFGAKVIHPPTMQPALNKDIPIRIKNTFNTAFSGTIIGRKNGESNFPIKGISSIDNISIIRVQGGGTLGVAGTAKRIFGALARHNISIILITQASSEHSLCIALAPKHAIAAKELLEEELKFEIREKFISEIIVETNLSIVAVVGENMRKTIGVSGKIFQALGKNGINVVAIAQGSSELNISTVIPREDEAKALNALHDIFFLSDLTTLNLFIIGAGLIGGELMEQIESQRQYLEKKHYFDVNIVAMANSKKMYFKTDGISFNNWKGQLLASEDIMDIDAFITKMKSLNLPNTVFVDCTSSEDIVKRYLDILKSSVSIVTPNKKANSSNYEYFNDLKLAALNNNVKFLYETNVGAGLPIIGTLYDMIASGDKILKIEGVLSGTLSYIFNSFDGLKPFSEVVNEAKLKGFTEPDPREDLNGLDVARKLLILSRVAGSRLELSDINVENLVPEELRSISSVDEFFARYKEYDKYYEERRKKATEKGCVLRYIAKYENGKAEISLQEVDSTHPFYNLSGSDNIISFKSMRYQNHPMVVKGPGAGAAVTAAGVFSDIIRIAYYLS
ncbi:MAG: bifunctional aspartate kinase/homoserine dehydrogenase I [Ignavibacteria bacterium]